jgi:hypothetical protein
MPAHNTHTQEKKSKGPAQKAGGKNMSKKDKRATENNWPKRWQWPQCVSPSGAAATAPVSSDNAKTAKEFKTRKFGNSASTAAFAMCAQTVIRRMQRSTASPQGGVSTRPAVLEAGRT